MAPASELKALYEQVFGPWEGFWDLFLKQGYREENCLTSREGNALAAALCWLDCSCRGERIAYLYAVATHPDFRGRGHCRTLMEKARQVLTARGYAGAVLVPENEGLRQMYGKLGYKTCTSVSEFTCLAGESAVPLRTVTEGEYAALRRRLLPAGAVLQEGENLAFLAAQAELLAGDTLLLAAWRQGGTLHAMELLGDREAAPGILRALGCETGHFRGPGEDQPFAMFLPLKEGIRAPSYFGFAFD